MPDLPTMTLSQAHFDRVVAAFPGATNAEKVATYKAWLTNRLLERVEMVESARIDRELGNEKVNRLTQMFASLPLRAEEPGLPATPVP